MNVPPGVPGRVVARSIWSRWDVASAGVRGRASPSTTDIAASWVVRVSWRYDRFSKTCLQRPIGRALRAHGEPNNQVQSCKLTGVENEVGTRRQLYRFCLAGLWDLPRTPVG